jgi:hypothetical protein
MVMRDLSVKLLVVLLAMSAAACGNDELHQCAKQLSGVEERNQELEEALTQSESDNRKLQEALALAQAEYGRLREDMSVDQAESRSEPDLSWVRENLWSLLHDDRTALWECDQSASQGTRAKEMPSASPDLMVQEINTRFKEQNPALEDPVLVLERIEGDTAVVTLERSDVVTEQMGSTGAHCFFASVTFSLTSFGDIEHVRFDIKPGNHGGPGTYDRTDFVYFLPLELGDP